MAEKTQNNAQSNEKKQDEKKPTAFKGVDSLFDGAAPKKEDTLAKDAATAAPGAEKKEDELALVSTMALHAFPDHPYTVDTTDNDMAELVDSIQREGLLERIVVQRRKEGGFEILSGHRRHRACEILGISEVPVIIKNGLSKDQSILLMVDANLKRKNILPMDEAKALKMQMDAMNRMGQRPAHGKVKRTDEAIAEKIGKNRMYVQRKVRLLQLAPDLQQAVNDKTLSETPAVEIASLPAEVQELVLDWMNYEDRAPTVAQAISVREHQAELAKTAKGKDAAKLLTEKQIDRIMDGEKLAEIFPPPPEPEKDKQAEPVPTGAAGPQAPIAGAEKVDGPAAPTSIGGAAGELPQAGAAAASNAIPFQPSTPIPGGAATPSPAAPTAPQQAAAPQPAPAYNQQVTADAQKSYIRTEYMAELRKDNVILPKTELKGLVPNCNSNSEYVAAIRAVLEQGREKQPDAKTAEVKPAPEKPAQDGKTVTPPVTPAPKSTEPVKADTTLSSTVKAPELSKTSTAPAATVKAPAAPQAVKADVPAPGGTPTPKPAEPPKVGTPPSVAPAPKPPEVPKTGAAPAAAVKAPNAAKPEPAKQNEGTKALDDFLKNKPRPGKASGPQTKTPDKHR